MASPDPEIKDGFSLPVWMKSKPTREFEPFAASPPAPEDTFFYLRYSKADALAKPHGEDMRILEPNLQAGTISGLVKDRDWSTHTKPCQDVMHGIAPINTAVSTSKPKAAGVDDGFKGEGAACGSSVVKVAHQMVSSSGRSASQRGFTVAAPEPEPAGDLVPSAAHLARRGSRSLPATPAQSPPSSPAARRRQHGNRYFTSPFEPSEEGVRSRSWLTTALLGLKKDLASSTSTLAEEEALEIRLHGGTLAESVESLGPAPRARPSAEPSQQPAPAKPSHTHTFRPRPSELREMNFLSPTSM